MLTVSSVAFAISFAALIFDGALHAGLSRAVGSFVVGGSAMAIIVGWKSQIVPVATFMQDGPAIIMASVVAGFAAREGVEISDVFVLLVVTTVASALAIRLLGRLGFGELGRYAPRSAVRALIGGTGWLLLKGSFEIMLNRDLGMADVGNLLDAEVAKFWLPGLVLGLVAWRIARSDRAPAYALGLTVFAYLAGFYLVVSLFSSIAAVESEGWLLGPLPEQGATWIVTPNELRTANWPGIARTSSGIASVVGVACMVQLMHLTGLRAVVDPDIDIGAELRTASGANLAVAWFGVTPGFQGFGYTVLLHRLNATRRAVPLVAGGLGILFGVFGVALVGYMPRLVVGAMLTLIGAALLADWAQEARQSASPIERLLDVAALAVAVRFGLLAGIGLGFAIAGVLFIARYSRLDPVRSTRSGRQVRSHVDRSTPDAQHLRATGHHLAVVELQGYLFFGSLAKIEDRLHEIAACAGLVRVLVLDFSHVSGASESDCAVLARLFRQLRAAGVAVCASAMAPALRETLLAADADLEMQMSFTPSLDTALVCAEGELLATCPPPLGLSCEVRASRPLPCRESNTSLGHGHETDLALVRRGGSHGHIGARGNPAYTLDL